MDMPSEHTCLEWHHIHQHITWSVPGWMDLRSLCSCLGQALSPFLSPWTGMPFSSSSPFHILFLSSSLLLLLEHVLGIWAGTDDWCVCTRLLSFSYRRVEESRERGKNKRREKRVELDINMHVCDYYSSNQTWDTCQVKHAHVYLNETFRKC